MASSSTKTKASPPTNLSWPVGKSIGKSKLPPGRYHVIAKIDIHYNVNYSNPNPVAQKHDFHHLKIHTPNESREWRQTGNIMVGFSHWFSVTGKVKQIIQADNLIPFTNSASLIELNEEDEIIDTEDCDGEKLSLRNSTQKYTIVKPGQCFLLHGDYDNNICPGDFYNTESPKQRRCMMTAEGDVLLSLNADFGREDGNYSWLFRKMDGRAAQYSAKSNLLRNEKIKKMGLAAASFRTNTEIPVMAFSPSLQAAQRSLPSSIWYQTFSFLTDAERHHFSLVLLRCSPPSYQHWQQQLPGRMTSPVPIQKPKLIRDLIGTSALALPTAGDYVCIATLGDQPSEARDITEEEVSDGMDVYGDGTVGLRYGLNNEYGGGCGHSNESNRFPRTMMYTSRTDGFTKVGCTHNSSQHWKEHEEISTSCFRSPFPPKQCPSGRTYNNDDVRYGLSNFLPVHDIPGGQRFVVECQDSTTTSKTKVESLETMDGDIELTIMCNSRVMVGLDLPTWTSLKSGGNINTKLLLRRILLNENDEYHFLNNQLSSGLNNQNPLEPYCVTNAVLHSRKAMLRWEEWIEGCNEKTRQKEVKRKEAIAAKSKLKKGKKELTVQEQEQEVLAINLLKQDELIHFNKQWTSNQDKNRALKCVACYRNNGSSKCTATIGIHCSKCCTGCNKHHQKDLPTTALLVIKRLSHLNKTNEAISPVKSSTSTNSTTPVAIQKNQQNVCELPYLAKRIQMLNQQEAKEAKSSKTSRIQNTLKIITITKQIHGTTRVYKTILKYLKELWNKQFNSN
jgi:hypothetical protein